MKKYLLSIFLVACLVLPAYGQTPYRSGIGDIGVSPHGLVLHLPFYAYGSEQSKIWDQSGNNNHGTITGAVPASYPLLSGVELVSNGGMESGNPPTGWTADGGGAIASDAVQFHSGTKSLKFTFNGTGTAPGGAYQLNVPTVIGKRYKMSAWVRGVDLAAGTWQFDFGGNVTVVAFSNGTWVYAEVYHVAISTTTTVEIYILPTDIANANKIFNIDDVSIQEVVGYEGLGWGFDGVDDKVTFPQINLGSKQSCLIWLNYQDSVDGVWIGGVNNYYNPYYDYVGQTIYYRNNSNTSSFSFPINLNEKLCVAITRDGIGPAQFYKNGTLIGGTGVLIDEDQILSTIGSFEINTYPTKMVVYEVLIFNRALSAQEIRNYFEKTRYRYGMDARDILIKYAEEFEYALAA